MSGAALDIHIDGCAVGGVVPASIRLDEDLHPPVRHELRLRDRERSCFRRTYRRKNCARFIIARVRCAVQQLHGIEERLAVGYRVPLYRQPARQRAIAQLCPVGRGRDHRSGKLSCASLDIHVNCRTVGGVVPASVRLNIDFHPFIDFQVRSRNCHRAFFGRGDVSDHRSRFALARIGGTIQHLYRIIVRRAVGHYIPFDGQSVRHIVPCELLTVCGRCDHWGRELRRSGRGRVSRRIRRLFGFSLVRFLNDRVLSILRIIRFLRNHFKTGDRDLTAVVLARRAVGFQVLDNTIGFLIRQDRGVLHLQIGSLQRHIGRLRFPGEERHLQPSQVFIVGALDNFGENNALRGESSGFLIPAALSENGTLRLHGNVSRRERFLLRIVCRCLFLVAAFFREVAFRLRSFRLLLRHFIIFLGSTGEGFDQVGAGSAFFRQSRRFSSIRFAIRFFLYGNPFRGFCTIGKCRKREGIACDKHSDCQHQREKTFHEISSLHYSETPAREETRSRFIVYVPAHNIPKKAHVCKWHMRDGGSCQEHRGIMFCILPLVPLGLPFVTASAAASLRRLHVTTRHIPFC